MDQDHEVLLKVFEIAEQRVRNHHSALWEEEKHYTWWISVVGGAILLVFVTDSLGPLEQAVGIALGCAIGVVLSLLGLRVVRREGEYFHEALQIRERTIVALGLNQPRNLAQDFTGPLDPQPMLRDFSSAKNQANKPILNLFLQPWKLGIRDSFQVAFCAATILFIGLGVGSLPPKLL